MAKKGAVKSEKRLAASRLIPLLRKERTWHIKARPGPHKGKNSVALGFVLRNLIGIVKTAKEAKGILNSKQVLVDGKIAKDPKRPVGLFDLVEVTPEKKTYRVLVGKKGKLQVVEEKFGENKKICKIVGKKTLGKEGILLSTNDGRTFKEKKTEAKVGDSLLVEVPAQKIIKILKQAPKKTVLVVDGRHIGFIAKIKGIVSGTMSRPKLVNLENETGEFMTVESNMIIVGDEKPEIIVE